MYKVDISDHAPSDVRLLAPFFLDEMWTRNLTRQVLDNAEIQHSIEPEDVNYKHDDGTSFVVEIEAMETKQNQAVASSLPMIMVHTDVFSTDTLTEAEAVAAMLSDSGMENGEIDAIVGAENWRNDDTIAGSYESTEQ